MNAAERFQVVSQEEVAGPPVDRDTALGTKMLTIGLSALSQRAVASLSSMVTIGFVASAWYLWREVLIDPSVMQLSTVGGYAVFILVIEAIRRRR